MFHTALCILVRTLFGKQLSGQKGLGLEGVAQEGQPLGVVRFRGRSRSWFWNVQNILTRRWKLSLIQGKYESSHQGT